MPEHPVRKALNIRTATQYAVSVEAKVDSSMPAHKWERYQRDIDELLASYAFAAATTGLVLLAARYEPAAAAAGVLHFLLRGAQALRASRMGNLETRVAKPHPLLYTP